MSVHPVSAGQQALWLLHRRDPERVGEAYTIAAAGRIVGAVDPAALAGAFDTLVARHPALRTRFPEAPPAPGSDSDSEPDPGRTESGPAEGWDPAWPETPVQVVRPARAPRPHRQLVATGGGGEDRGLLEIVDGAGWAAAEVPERLAELAYRPFDLARGPLVRAVLVRRGGEAVLLLALHHLVGDLWSLAVLVRELGKAYRSCAAGRAGTADLEPLRLTHGEWVRRRYRALAGEEGERLWAFWRGRMESGAPPLELPTDRPRPALQSFAGEVVFRPLGRPAGDGDGPQSGLRSALGRLARRAGTQRFTALLAAYQVVLSRWSGQDDFLVGSPTAGRGDVRAAGSELAGVVGYFVNPVPIRAPLAGDPTFRDLLERLGEETAAVLAHQDLPFPWLAEHALATGAAERDPSRPPVFQTLFVLQKSPIPGMRGLGAFALGREGAPLRLDADDGGLELASVPLPQRGAQFDLSLYVTDEGGELVGSLEYNRDLFSRATAERFLDHLAAVLHGAVAEPERRISELPLLGAAERRQVLEEWAPGRLVTSDRTASERTGAPGRPGLLHERFLAAAAAAPDEEALLWAAPAAEGSAGAPGQVAEQVQALTRGALAERSARVARRLRALGVGPEVPVGVFLDRTPELVVALLGVLRAGGAYVPMDPAYPPERIATMIEDSGMPLVITGPGLAERLVSTESTASVALGGGGGGGEGGEGQEGRGVVELAALEAEAAPAPDSAAYPAIDSAIDPVSGEEPPVTPDALAYVIYTSGSTGRPKGVAISHRSASALIDWAGEELSADELAGVLAATSVCFDLSVFELFAPLSLGGRIVLASDALALGGHPAADRVTLVNTVPSAMEGLCAEGALPASVRTVCLAGEPLRGRLVDAVYSSSSSVERVLNLYGPSEDTTYSTGALCPRRAPAADGGVQEVREPTIGRALPGGRAYVVDPGLGLQPRGVPGELVLGGAGLARGYLRRPALTAERFVPDPFGPAGGRLYRTGDLAQWLPGAGRVGEPIESGDSGEPGAGELEYLGRLDHQVKVRGFRIELGEVEVALASHPQVAEAVVVVRGEGGDRRLVGYVAATGEEPPGVASLRSFLGQRLPGYMVPDALVLLDTLPRTPNGKVDRKALPEPAGGRAGVSGEYVEPETAVELILAAMWREVLDVERVGIHDSFFELGGHSISAHRLLLRVREEFGVDVPVHDLFARPTIAGLATAIAEALMAGLDEETLAEVMDGLDG